MPISAPTVGLSFGSFGDIVTVLQLAWELRAALDESAGASAELRALVGDVDSFTRALQDVQANIERRRRTLRPDVVNGIAAALSRCRNVLHAINQRIERARGQTSRSGWQKYWGTTAWTILGGKKDVEALRARLSEQLGIMQLYLSLSEANCQERVEDVLVANSTTLQHIYTVVQDIQLRFDVGVPGFQFYDSPTNKYYPPLARTSLQRLSDVYDALRRRDGLDKSSFLSKYGANIEDDFRYRAVRSETAWINVGGDERSGGCYIDFYPFREAVFGKWQVLVARTRLDPYVDAVLKTILERNHAIGNDCNCAVACSTRYRDDVNDMVLRREATTAYSEVISLLFAHLQPARLPPGFITSLMTAFKNWPDPEHLRSTVATILSRQRLLPHDMIDLISKTSNRTLAHPLICFYSNHTIDLFVRGAALSRCLVGDALPHFDETLSQEVHLPGWGYIPFGEIDENGGEVLSFAMNLNNECPCHACMRQHGDTLEADITEAREMFECSRGEM